MTTDPQTVCRTCVTPIGLIESPTGSWWAHDTHPADDHDAVPAAWVDGDPLMEAIAGTVWEHCATEGTSLIVDDPRNIAATAAAVARAQDAAVSSAAATPPTGQAALRKRIAEALKGVRVWRTVDGCDGWEYAGTDALTEAVAAILLPPTDRAAVLREAADAAEGVAMRLRDQHDIGGATGAYEVMTELRRLAAETAGPEAQAARCDDPIERGHESALGEARETNRRLNLRAQQLESELATYRRAVRQWEVSERGTYVPLRTIAAIAKAAGRDIENPRWLLHYQRVEQAEAAIERVRQLHDQLAAETDLTAPDDPVTRGAAAQRIATALDGWNPTNAPQCDVEFEGGARCAKPAGHRPRGSDDPHVPGPSADAPAAVQTEEA